MNPENEPVPGSVFQAQREPSNQAMQEFHEMMENYSREARKLLAKEMAAKKVENQ